MKDEKKDSLIKRVYKKKKLLIILTVIAVIGFFGWQYFSNKNGDFEKIEVKRGIVREELILSGSIRADEHANLTFQTSGELDWIGVTEGDEVEKGQKLVKLDTTSLYHALQSAEADLRKYESTVDRVYDDVQGSETDESFSEIETRTIAETAKDKAYRAYAIAQKNLANSTLRAPFDGIVTSITNPFSGINTMFSQSQIEIVNLQTIYFDVSADQSEVTDLYVGQKVNMVLDSFSDEEIEGEIVYISYTPKTGDVGTVYEVKVSLSDELDIKKVRVGMTGDAKFVLSQKEDVLYVPPEFVNSDKNGKYVRLGKANNKVYLEVGIEGEERVEVVGEIKEGDTVYD